MEAVTPLNATVVLPSLKPLPVMMTVEPTGPLPGEKPVIAGAMTGMIKLKELVATPPQIRDNRSGRCELQGAQAP